MTAQRIHFNGIVQGVGFRPCIARIARGLGLAGWVRNSTSGVDLHLEGAATDIEAFHQAFIEQAPRAAVIISKKCSPAHEEGLSSFEIIASEHDEARSTLVSPDLATCPECLEELLDPKDRRYHYPFINCTNCGPRFTIINDLPYDRPATSMGEFEMCPQCAEEYGTEEDRRYHAQPDACFECGPRLWLVPVEQVDDGIPYLGTPNGTTESLREASDLLIEEAAHRLAQGQVLAVKGLGGWHLCCDATNHEAVATLRQRKHRPSKPLAVMVKDLDEARRLCHVSDAEAMLLESPAHPILLMRHMAEGVADNVAGALPELGLMLPSTPVQHLLIRAAGVPLVMTSANRSGEPIVAEDQDAFDALRSIADAFLGNNRAIVARYDDSVARILGNGTVQMVRRARGYAPTPLFHSAADSSPVIFAAGPEQKATFCLLDGKRAFISQHLGDLESLGSWRAWEQAQDRYQRLFGIQPTALACDLHPEYLSSKWARQYAAETGLPLIEVQHHHAHIASVMGENDLHDPIIGVALDGTGYGLDGTIWGCEILIASRQDFQRHWHLPCFPLPGGAAAIHDPRRTALGLLHAEGQVDNVIYQEFLQNFSEAKFITQMIEKSLNSPLCSSAGRFFDAAAALMGLVERAGYDGEPACLLEAQAHREIEAGMPFETFSWDKPLTAVGVHAWLVEQVVAQCEIARSETGIETIALSGGCMVNRLLSSKLVQSLEKRGFKVHLNKQLPPNDGCISYGQAVVAEAILAAQA